MPNGNIYNKWLSHILLIPWIANPLVSNHNLTIFTQYYKTNQHTYYTTLLQTHFFPAQPKDTQFIPPPTTLPLLHISLPDCNPHLDITTNTHTITITYNQAFLYLADGLMVVI
jgi:hypothetical protein